VGANTMVATRLLPSGAPCSRIEYQSTVPIASRSAKTGAPLVTQPSSLFGTDKSDQAPASNSHRSTPASVRTPPRFQWDAAISGKS
jgi:hypothetical protein